MQDQAPKSTTISGDLPIRSARRACQPNGLETQQPEKSQDKPKKAQVEDAKDEQPKPKPKLGKKTTDLEEEISLAVGPEIAVQMQQKTKRKKNRRPKSKRGLGQPTGFEEWAVEGPLTPEEYAEDIALYDPSKSFIDRLEGALMRYERKRRIESFRRNVFHKFLQYGGITIGPNFGTGVPARELKDMTQDEIMQARTQTMIEKERGKLDISFNEVLRGFLGSFFMRYFNPENEEAIKFTTNTISNFYTYLLYHGVCPEYNEDILKARKTCDLASKELWLNLQLICQGPGSFNKSCSLLFGGHYFGRAGPDDWSGAPSTDGVAQATEHAQRTMKHAIAGAGPHDTACLFLQLVENNSLTAKQVDDIDGFTVVSVIEPEASCRDFYHQYAKDLTPTGLIKAKSFIDPAKPQIDLSPKERWDWDHGKAPSYEFTFFVEMDLLPLFYPGVMVVGNIWKLNCGVYYFDQVFSVYPSFNNVIANDMMLGWKRPRDVTQDETPKRQASAVNTGMDDAVKEALNATGHKVGKDDKSSKHGNGDEKEKEEEENSMSESE